MYPADEVDAPYAWDQDRETLAPSLRANKATADVEFASMEHLKRIRALYYGNISLIDKGVGRILRALDALGLAENTLVVFASDHGEMMGDHGLFQKSKPYEASMRVPFLMRAPGRVQAGSTPDDRVSQVDLMPTFLDAAGVTYPGTPDLPGESLLSRDGGGPAARRDEYVVEHGGGASRWLSLLRGPWKYNYYIQGGWEELFNLEDDPREMTNLVLGGADAQARSVADEMKRDLAAWEREHGFDTSFDADGELRATEAPTNRSLRPNSQFPTWVDNLSPEENALMESPGESVLNAMRHEWTYDLTDLNLRAYKDAGGSLEGTEAQALLDRP